MYATLEQLVQTNMLTGGADRRSYTFAVTVDGNRGCRVTAKPSQAHRAGWPTLEPGRRWCPARARER